MINFPQQFKLLAFCLIIGFAAYKLIKSRGGNDNNQNNQNADKDDNKNYNEVAPTQSNYSMLNKFKPYKQGQPQLIEMFGTNCPPCKQQMPHIAQLSKQYPDLFICSVSSDPESQIINFINENPACKSINIGSDQQKQVSGLARRLGVNGVPHCFMFDANNKLVWHGHPSQVDLLARKMNAKGDGWKTAGKGRKL